MTHFTAIDFTLLPTISLTSIHENSQLTNRYCTINCACGDSKIIAGISHRVNCRAKQSIEELVRGPLQILVSGNHPQELV